MLSQLLAASSLRARAALGSALRDSAPGGRRDQGSVAVNVLTK